MLRAEADVAGFFLAMDLELRVQFFLYFYHNPTSLATVSLHLPCPPRSPYFLIPPSPIPRFPLFSLLLVTNPCSALVTMEPFIKPCTKHSRFPLSFGCHNGRYYWVPNGWELILLRSTFPAKLLVACLIISTQHGEHFFCFLHVFFQSLVVDTDAQT